MTRHHDGFYLATLGDKSRGLLTVQAYISGRTIAFITWDAHGRRNRVHLTPTETAGMVDTLALLAVAADTRQAVES
jgi:hypothetical protein